MNMFVGSCSGCIQVPAPVYYWTPYPTLAAKKHPYNIADLLQASHSLAVKNSSATDISIGNGHFYASSKSDNRQRNIEHYVPGRKRTSGGDLKDRKSPNNDFVGEVLNFSKKVEQSKCTLPSALEPLQALCSSGPRGYGSSGSSGRHSCSPTPSGQSRGLKFGISAILGDDFGKEKRDKDNSSISDSVHRSNQSKRACECTYEGCQMYQQIRFPAHALSAVHALQPPKYPPGTGADVLPGPYSILNTDVTIGPHAKRKRSWSRAVFSNLQRKGLEKRFEVQKYVTKPDRRQLAAMLGLTDAQVKVWFQNRRMKWRHAQQQGTDTEENTAGSKEQEPCETSGNSGDTGCDVDDSGHESENDLHIDEDMMADSENEEEGLLEIQDKISITDEQNDPIVTLEAPVEEGHQVVRE